MSSWTVPEPSAAFRRSLVAPSGPPSIARCDPSGSQAADVWSSSSSVKRFLTPDFVLTSQMPEIPRSPSIATAARDPSGEIVGLPSSRKSSARREYRRSARPVVPPDIRRGASGLVGEDPFVDTEKDPRL